jgi:hypothetical protein
MSGFDGLCELALISGPPNSAIRARSIEHRPWLVRVFSCQGHGRKPRNLTSRFFHVERNPCSDELSFSFTPLLTASGG